MESDSELSAELQTIQRRWDTITAAPTPPRSTMDVIEHGLGDRQRSEVYVNRLLCYLLDPSEPHQMGADFLAAFLEELPAATGFDEDMYDLSDVRVNQQVTVRDEIPAEKDDSDETPGYADLVLDVPNEWILLIELKFSAKETGTRFYCQASQIGGRPVEEYESGQYYLYLHQRNRQEASGNCFANWTWKDFRDDVLDPFLAENVPQYPQRTIAQLYDLRYDLEGITDMTDRHDADEEKIALYLDHRDAIEDVSQTFDAAWEDYSQRWGEELASVLETEGIDTGSSTDDGFPVVNVLREEDETERWIFRDTGGDWQHLFKHGWHVHEETLETLEKRADDTNDLRIGFYHRMGENSNKNSAVGERTLLFNFRSMGSNPSEFSTIYDDLFAEQRSKIEGVLPDRRVQLTGNKLTKIEGTYDIRASEQGDFFEAYTMALSDAFTDLVVDNPELIEILDQVFEEAVELYTT